MHTRTLLLSIALATTTLAGCIGSDGDLETQEADPLGLLDGPLTDIEYLCPPGETMTRADGLCIRTLATRTESNQEPFLAIDPNDPKVMAIGVNAGHTTGVTAMTADHPGADLILMDVFVTEDGGETWTLSQIPYIPSDETLPVDTLRGSGDPALAFDEQGALHVSGIFTKNLYGSGWEIFYTSSSDRGASWSEPIALTSDGDNDRNWLAVAPGGHLFIPWQNVGDSTQVAHSADAGLTWEVSPEIADCITVSQMVFVDGRALIACAGLDDDGLSGIEVHAYDPGRNAFEEVAELEDVETVWPQLVRTANGVLVLVTEDFEDDTVLLLRSQDGGENWSEPYDVRGAFTLDDPWSYVSAHWFAGDPWGGLHLVLTGSEAPVELPVLGGILPERRIAHVVLDPADWSLLSEQALHTDDMEESMRMPPSLAPNYGDHYFGVAFTAEEGFLVWTRDKGLDITRFAPVVESDLGTEG